MEYPHHVFPFNPCGLRVRPMTLEAKRVSLRAQQLGKVAAVGIVASRTALLECGLVQDPLAVQFGLVAVTGEAHIYRVRFEKAGRATSVRAVTIGAVTGGSGMLHLGRLDLPGLLLVATHAQFTDAGFGQHHFPILGRGVTGLALRFFEGLVDERLQELRAGGLVWVVATQTIGFLERQVTVGLGKSGLSHIVAIQSQCWRALGEMENTIHLLADFVALVATVAAHIQRGVAAA